MAVLLEGISDFAALNGCGLIFILTISTTR